MYACKRFMESQAKHTSAYAHAQQNMRAPTGPLTMPSLLDNAGGQGGRGPLIKKRAINSAHATHMHLRTTELVRAKAFWPAPLLEFILRHETRISMKQIKLLNQTGGANMRPGKQFPGGEGGKGAVNKNG